MRVGIQDFLLLEELNCDAVIQSKPASHANCHLNFNNVVADWSLTGNPLSLIHNSIIENTTLKDISFTIHSGQSFAVIGHVGSGKVY